MEGSRPGEPKGGVYGEESSVRSWRRKSKSGNCWACGGALTKDGKHSDPHARKYCILLRHKVPEIPEVVLRDSWIAGAIARRRASGKPERGRVRAEGVVPPREPRLRGGR